MEALLIDDHQLVNMGLASCLEETKCFTSIKQASSLAEAVSFIEKPGEETSSDGTSRDVPSQELPDIIILDIMLGEDNGLDFLPFLKEHCRKNK